MSDSALSVVGVESQSSGAGSVLGGKRSERASQIPNPSRVTLEDSMTSLINKINDIFGGCMLKNPEEKLEDTVRNRFPDGQKPLGCNS